MHPTTQFADASLRQAERQRAAQLARMQRDLVARRRARLAVSVTAAVRGILPGAVTASPPVCCPA